MRGSLGRRPGCCVAFHVCGSILVGHGIKLTILCFSLLRSSLGHLWEAGQAPGVRAGGAGSGALASDPQAAAAFLAWGIQAPLQLEGVSLLRVHSSPCSLRPEVASCAPTAPPRGWRGHSCVAQGAGAGGRGAPGVGAGFLSLARGSGVCDRVPGGLLSRRQALACELQDPQVSLHGLHIFCTRRPGPPTTSVPRRCD